MDLQGLMLLKTVTGLMGYGPIHIGQNCIRQLLLLGVNCWLVYVV